MKKNYPPETAGGKMIEAVPLASPEEKILDVKNRLFEKMKELETINYIYVVDRERKLVGVFSLKEIFRKPEETKVKDIMQTEIIKARPHTDQERIAILALTHNLKSIPVVDREDHFLGVVTSDTILDILHSEHIEDILRFAGISKHDTFPAKILQAPAGILAKLRLPWLILGLFGGLFAAQIVNFFEGSLKTHFVLAAFIPLIVYMADAVGTQTETLFIRSLAVNFQLDKRKYFLKEVKISLFIALTLGVLLALISFLWFGLPYVGVILGISLFFTIVAAFFLGLLIPHLLNKFKKDPAIGSGPLGTIIRDILSLIIYFSVASLILKFF